MAIPDGVYRIVSKLEPNSGAEVAGGSLAAMANIHLYHFNDTNAQKVLLTTNSDGSRRITNVKSGFVAEAAGGYMNNGTNIRQYWFNDTDSQKWFLVELPGGYVKIQCKKDILYVWDVFSAQTTDRSNINIWNDNASDAQQWSIIKDSMLSTQLSIPTEIGLAESDTSGKIETPMQAGTKTWYPTWIGGPGEYQLRYRYRSRTVGTDIWTEYSDWMSPSGSTDDEGWGDAWAPTGSDTGASNVRHGPPLTFTIDQVTYDQIDVQVTVRRCQTNGDPTYGFVHGGSATADIKIYWDMQLTIGAVTFTPEGLSIPYNSDYLRSSKKMTIDVKTSSKRYLVRDFLIDEPRDPVGTIVIPFDQMQGIPDDGQEITVVIKYLSYDAILYDRSVKTNITYSGGHGTTVTAAWEDGDGYTAVVDLGTHQSTGAWIVYERGDGTQLIPGDPIPDEPGKYRLYPPFGSDYKAYLMVKDSDSVWATEVETRPKLKSLTLPPGFYIWNYDDNDYTILVLDAEYNNTVERDYEAYLTAGRRGEAIYFGESSKRPHSLTGHVVPEFELEHSSYSDFERLSMCNYALFRTPTGGIFNVAVVSTSDSSTWTRYKKWDIEMRERS